MIIYILIGLIIILGIVYIVLKKKGGQKPEIVESQTQAPTETPAAPVETPTPTTPEEPVVPETPQAPEEPITPQQPTSQF